MFKISFRFLDKTYSGMVLIIKTKPVQYVVFRVAPQMRNIPEKLVYESDAENDQLIYKSVYVSERDFLYKVGESILSACEEQRINVHTGVRQVIDYSFINPQSTEEKQAAARKKE